MLNCFAKTFQAEGLTAFYSGFIPNFARLGSWNAAMFVTAEYVSPVCTVLFTCSLTAWGSDLLLCSPILAQVVQHRVLLS